MIIAGKETMEIMGGFGSMKDSGNWQLVPRLKTSHSMEHPKRDIIRYDDVIY